MGQRCRDSVDRRSSPERWLQHAAISLAALVAVGTLAAIICVQAVQDQALRRAEQLRSDHRELGHRTEGDPGCREARHRRARRVSNTQVRSRMATDTTIQRIKVWSPNGRILYCDDPIADGTAVPAGR